MAAPEVKQRRATILLAEAFDFWPLLYADQRSTLATLSEFRDVFRAAIEGNKGRVVDTAGDSVLAIFESASNAVRAAVDTQAELRKRNEALPEDRRMQFRIGVNLGDIHELSDGTTRGDGVITAARLQNLAEPGATMISQSVYQEVRHEPDMWFAYEGEHEVTNIGEQLHAYRILSDGTHWS